MLPVLEVAEEWEAFERGEDGGEDPLGGGDVVDAAAVTEGDAGWKPGDDPVDAGHHGLDDLDSAETTEGVYGIFAREGENPEVDVVDGGGVTGYADDLNLGSGREIAEEIGGEGFVDTDTEHAV